MNGPFAHPAVVDAENLRVEPFLETRNVEAFDCGNKDLNDFLTTDEVRRYEREKLGRTYLVFHEGDLVGFFTISSDAVRTEYLRRWKSFTKLSEIKIDSIPALKIGRLAVDKRCQNQGIGRALAKYIIGMALDESVGLGVRLVVLQAKPESVSFYQKLGFELTEAVGRERGRTNRTMFLDLGAIANRDP